MKTKILVLIALVVSSCAVKQPVLETKITPERAKSVMTELAGTQKPDRDIYHTYEEIFQRKTWSKNMGVS